MGHAQNTARVGRCIFTSQMLRAQGNQIQKGGVSLSHVARAMQPRARCQATGILINRGADLLIVSEIGVTTALSIPTTKTGTPASQRGYNSFFIKAGADVER